MNLLATFLQRAILQGVPILYGASGEILTEKSGNLNLGIPGIMYMGGVSGLIAAFFYERAAGERASGLAGLFLSLGAALLISMLAGLLYSFLTVTLRANQNVVGLSLTTFGVGFGNFFGGSLSQLAGGCLSAEPSGALEAPLCGQGLFLLRLPHLFLDHPGALPCLRIDGHAEGA